MNIENQKEYMEKIKKINEGKNLKYSIFTMGCQLNENDSEKLCGMLDNVLPASEYPQSVSSVGGSL